MDAAAGVAGITEAALALQQRKILPTLHCQEACEQLALSGTPLRLNQELLPLPQKQQQHKTGEELVLHAGVSSTGMGRTNVHIILASAPGSRVTAAKRAGDGAHSATQLAAWQSESSRAEAPSQTPEAQQPVGHVLCLSAHTPCAVAAAACKLADLLDAEPQLPLGDVSASLSWRRAQMQQRLAVVASDARSAACALREAATKAEAVPQSPQHTQGV